MLIKMVWLRGSISEILKERSNETALNSKYDGKQRGLASMVYRFFDKKRPGVTIKARGNVNEAVAQELHKPEIKKFKRTKVYLKFEDNI